MSIIPLADIKKDLCNVALRRSMVERQLAPWYGKSPFATSDLPSAARDKVSSYLFQFRNNNVYCEYRSDQPIEYARRAQAYHVFFIEISFTRTLPELDFILDVGDGAVEAALPVFTFQKQRGSSNILLPDIDFLTSGFYMDKEQWGLPDDLSFLEKGDTASFVGSTTGGGYITRETLSLGAVPRVEAARFFKCNDRVRFELPNIVQCDRDATEQLLSEGFGGPFSSWKEQLCSKFLISMDGNGATCSRVFIALASNSVLLKYDSDDEILYLDELVPGLHYIPIRRHEDVIEVLEAEAKRPGYFDLIATQSRSFAVDHLSRFSLEEFTFDLFQKYASLTTQGLRKQSSAGV